MTEQEALKLALEAMTYADACLKKQLTTKDKHEYAQDLLLEAGTAINEALAQPEQEPVKLWLWKNFVDGRPEYWAFDNAFPINLDNGDPQTLGEPCGYAWLKPSRQGRFDVSDEEILRAVQNAKESPPQRTWVGLSEEDRERHRNDWHSNIHDKEFRAIEAKLKEKNT